MNIGSIQPLTPEERTFCLKEGRCLRCRQQGHTANRCLVFTWDRPRVNGISFQEPTPDENVSEEDDDNKDDDVMYLGNLFSSPPSHLLTVQGKAAQQSARFLIDPGAQGNFLSLEFARRHHLNLRRKTKPLSIGLASGSKLTPCTYDVSFIISLNLHYSVPMSFDVLPLNFDAILG